VDPDRKPWGLIALAAARGAEVEDLLPCRMDCLAENFGEQLAEPWTAREDEMIGFEPSAAFEAQHASVHHRQRMRRAISAAEFYECVADDAAGAACGEGSGATLEPDRLHSVEIDLRVALRGIGDGHRIDCESELAQDRERGAHVGVVAAVHPERACFDVQRGIELLPPL